MSRKGIAEVTRLTAGTISNLTGELLQRGILVEGEERVVTGIVGRREILLDVNPKSHFVFAIHVARHKLSCAVITLTGDILELEEFEISDASLSDLVGLITSYVQCSSYRDEVMGLGLGYYGQTIHSVSSMIEPRPYPVWLGSDLAHAIQERVGIPVVADNNVQNMALAEKLFGMSKELREVLFLYADVGVGGGLIIDGEPSQIGHAELGHMTIDINGPRCWCGNKGCVELYTGEDYLIKKAVQLVPELQINGYPTLNDVLARGEDESINHLLRETAEILSIALNNVLHVLSVQRVVVCGRIFNNDIVWDAFLSLIQKLVPVSGDNICRCSISFEKVGIMGAGSLAIYDLLIKSDSNVWNEYPDRTLGNPVYR